MFLATCYCQSTTSHCGVLLKFSASGPTLYYIAGGGSSETRLSAAAAVKRLAKAAPALTHSQASLAAIVPALVAALKDMAPAVKPLVERTMLHVLEARIVVC